MKKLRPILLACWLIFFTGISFAQKANFSLVVDGKKEGIVGSYSFCQDQKGYIWITSFVKGLIRYDGKKLISFSHNSDNPNSIANNQAIMNNSSLRGIK